MRRGLAIPEGRPQADAAVLLCGLSVMLTLLNWTSPGGPPPLLALNVLSPFPITAIITRIAAVLAPLAIAAMFLFTTTARQLEGPDRLAIALLACPDAAGLPGL